jgi:hypothetical protein
VIVLSIAVEAAAVVLLAPVATISIRRALAGPSSPRGRQTGYAASRSA